MTTFAEMSKKFAAASEKTSPEEREGGNQPTPVKPAAPADENENSPDDGEVMVPDPKPKTAAEMATDPKPLLADEIDQTMVDEMGAAEMRDIPDGNASAVSTSMNDMSNRIKNA